MKHHSSPTDTTLEEADDANTLFISSLPVDPTKNKKDKRYCMFIPSEFKSEFVKAVEECDLHMLNPKSPTATQSPSRLSPKSPSREPINSNAISNKPPTEDAESLKENNCTPQSSPAKEVGSSKESLKASIGNKTDITAGQTTNTAVRTDDNSFKDDTTSPPEVPTGSNDGKNTDITAVQTADNSKQDSSKDTTTSPPEADDTLKTTVTANDLSNAAKLPPSKESPPLTPRGKSVNKELTETLKRKILVETVVEDDNEDDEDDEDEDEDDEEQKQKADEDDKEQKKNATDNDEDEDDETEDDEDEDDEEQKKGG
jgi:hypothetical protein